MLRDREGSNAGRGFRYQDAVAGLQVVASWAGEAAPALVIPEGGDDVERREEHGAALVQVKSRREHLGPLGLADAAKHVAELWGRAGRINGEPFAFELVVERGVARCGELTVSGLPDPLARVLAEDPRAGPLLPRTRLVVAQAPREDAIQLVAGRAGCSPLAAELCVARLVARIGDLADANGRRTPANYRGSSTADVDAIVADTLIATDPEALERAVREGACEPVDFLTPLDEPDFHLGIDVQPGHVAAGLVAERPTARSKLSPRPCGDAQSSWRVRRAPASPR